MNELTLTGATLLSDHPPEGTRLTNTTSSATQGSWSSAATTSSHHNDHHNHHHHSHHHHAHSCCSAAHAPPRPTLPLAELLQHEPALIYATLHQLVRVGTFDLYHDICQAYAAQYYYPAGATTTPTNNNNSSSSSSTSSNTNEESLPSALEATTTTHTTTSTTTTPNTTSTTSTTNNPVLSTLLSQYDDKGYSLLHWAVKRTDDVRFVQHLLPLLVTIPTTTTTNTTTTTTTSTTTTTTRPAWPVSRDDTAMTPLHWACTEEHALPIIRLLLKHDALLRSSSSNTTTSSSRHNNNNNKHTTTTPLLEWGDSTGCTPLLIAAQHGHVETVAYLILLGANQGAMDTSRDTATHWAAYKGSLAVLGLLQYYDPDGRWYQTRDAYGQTPLHLAALRGHTRACRMILHALAQTQADRTVLFWKDRNGRTPYALAVHKEQHTVAHVLQQHMERLGSFTTTATTTTTTMDPPGRTWRRMLPPQRLLQRYLQPQVLLQQFCSKHAWMVWLGLSMPGMEELDASPQFPAAYVWLHIGLNLIYYFTVLVPLTNPEAGILWDWMLLHMINQVWVVLCVWNLVQMRRSNPGRLDDRHPDIQRWRRLYETTLQALAEEETETTTAKTTHTLCHSCHIARPPRSKHDRFTGACILMFDHHCPFVANSVGLDNYRYFYCFCLTMSLYFIGFWILLGVYWYRTTVTVNEKPPIWTLLAGVFLAVHGVMPLGMWIYHTQLTANNLTTNEHIHARKYPYFWQTAPDGSRRFVNPWNRGVWHNFMTRLGHSSALSSSTSSSSSSSNYLLPEQMTGLLWSSANNTNNSMPSPYLQDDEESGGSGGGGGSSMNGHVHYPLRHRDNVV